MSDRAIGGVQTVTRAVQVLKIIARHAHGGLRLTEIAALMDMPAPTAHRLLKGLVREGMLTRLAGAHRYVLGPLVFELGLAAAHQFNLNEVCAPILERLAQQTGDTAFLFVRSGNDAVCIGRVQGTYPIQTPVVPIGGRQPLGVNAGGLALLSCLPDEEVSHVLAAVAPRLSVYGNLDADDIRRHCLRSRAQSYAWISNHAVPGISAVGLPILNAQGTAIAAITVATTQSRMTESRVAEILPMLKSAASSVTQALQQ